MNDHILLVDDDISILDGFEEILTKNDYSVSRAQDEKEAIQKISGQTCNAAIIDLVLAESSGLDLINTIQKLSNDIAVIAITGYPSIESARESFKRGAFEYLEKPCEKEKLISTVKRAIDKKRFESEINQLKRQKEILNNLLYLDNEDLGARIRSVYSQMGIVIQGADKFANFPSEEAKNEYMHLVKLIALMVQNTLKKFIFNGLKIFIVDNDLLTLSSLNNQLSTLGCMVTLSNNSEEAKLMLKNSKPYHDICLIEKDMFGMNGFELTNFIRNEISSQMPIIGISYSALPEDKNACIKAGMNRFLTKPIDAMQLKLQIMDLILNKRYLTIDEF